MDENEPAVDVVITWKHVRADAIDKAIVILQVDADERRFFCEMAGKSADMRNYVQAMLETLRSSKRKGILRNMTALELCENLEVLLGFDIENFACAWELALDHRLRVPVGNRMPIKWYKERCAGRKRPRDDDIQPTQGSDYTGETATHDGTTEDETSDDDSTEYSDESNP